MVIPKWLPLLAFLAAFSAWMISVAVTSGKKSRKTGASDDERLGEAFDGAPFVRPKTRSNVRANHVPAEPPIYKWGNQLDVVMPNRIIKAKNNL